MWQYVYERIAIHLCHNHKYFWEIASDAINKLINQAKQHKAHSELLPIFTLTWEGRSESEYFRLYFSKEWDYAIYICEESLLLFSLIEDYNENRKSSI